MMTGNVTCVNTISEFLLLSTFNWCHHSVKTTVYNVNICCLIITLLSVTASFINSTPITPFRCEDLGDISYTSQVIAYFVAIVTELDRDRICVTLLNRPTRKPSARHKDLKISLLQAEL